MKQITTILAAVLLTVAVFAQAPQKMTYQAVVRNSSDALVQSSPVGMKVTILQGSITGTAVYVETHTTVTNQNGLLNIEIGGGAAVSGTYENGIFWGGGPYFLKTEIDPLGGNSYTITGTSELLSVPYANYSQVSGSLVGAATSWLGAYTYVKPLFPDEIWYLYITYLTPNTVLIFASYQDAAGFYPKPMIGQISGVTINLPSQYMGQSDNFLGGQIIRNGNTIEITAAGNTIIWTKL